MMRLLFILSLRIDEKLILDANKLQCNMANDLRLILAYANTVNHLFNRRLGKCFSSVQFTNLHGGKQTETSFILLSTEVQFPRLNDIHIYN